MADLGLALLSVELGHPRPEVLARTLRALGVAHLAYLQHATEPGLWFTMKTSLGDTVALL